MIFAYADAPRIIVPSNPVTSCRSSNTDSNPQCLVTRNVSYSNRRCQWSHIVILLFLRVCCRSYVNIAWVYFSFFYYNARAITLVSKKSKDQTELCGKIETEHPHGASDPLLNQNAHEPWYGGSMPCKSEHPDHSNHTQCTAADLQGSHPKEDMWLCLYSLPLRKKYNHSTI
jgi:hypothetical protein